MTVLDDIIDASVDSNVAASDLLRRVQVAASRLGTAEVVEWARNELSGYRADDPLPTYRVRETEVNGVFTGPMREVRQFNLSVKLPSLEPWWTVEMRQPVMEIQALAEAEGNLSREWSAYAVHEYEHSKIFALEFFGLYQAHNIITPQSLRGVIDVIRSKALEFALDLQSADPTAGSVGGPTVATEPALALVVYNVTNNIYGDGANVATGSQIEQRSKVNMGDAEALRREAEALGLSGADAEEFTQILIEEESVDTPKVRRFLDRVRTGAVAAAAGVGTDLAAGSLLELGKGFLGL
ncbi:AbiTii domain-containing protein [Microbacterium xylanilyticum]